MSDDGTQTVAAKDLRRGDHLHLTRENGRSHGGGAAVMMVWPGPAHTSVTIWTGDITYRNDEPVTIDVRG